MVCTFNVVNKTSKADSKSISYLKVIHRKEQDRELRVSGVQTGSVERGLVEIAVVRK